MPDSGNAASEKAKELIDEAPEQVEKIRLQEKDREWREKMVDKVVEGNALTMKTATPEDYEIDVENITSEAQLDMAKALLEKPPTEANKLLIWENSRAQVNAEMLDRQRVIDQRDARAFADLEIEKARMQSQPGEADKQAMQKNEKDQPNSNLDREKQVAHDAEYESQLRKGNSETNAAQEAAKSADAGEKQRQKDAKGLEEQRKTRQEMTTESKDRDEAEKPESGKNVKK